MASVDHIARSANAHLLSLGVVYPLAYRSQTESHRRFFRNLGEAARRDKRRVWRHDRSLDGSPLRSHASLGPHGDLVLFRRSVTFFRSAPRGVTFKTWLRELSHSDDGVRAGDGPWRHLSYVLAERDGVVSVTHDVTDILFAED